MKKCYKCGKLLPESEFVKDKYTTSGLNAKCKSCKRKQYYESGKNSYVENKYGISLQDYNGMYESQDGKCAICGIKKSLKGRGRSDTLHIDHNHETGEVRSLLCMYCNVALGLLKENKQTLRNMLEYLGED